MVELKEVIKRNYPDDFEIVGTFKQLKDFRNDIHNKLIKELIKALENKNPMEEADKYFAELKEQNKTKFHYSDFVMYVRDNYIKEELKTFI